MEKTEVKKRTSNVTAKTLGALRDMMTKISKEKLITDEELRKMIEITEKIKENWIKRNL